MMLSDKQVNDFRELYKTSFGKEISFEEAYEQGIKLLTLMQEIYKPMTQEEHDWIEERRKTMAAVHPE
jgi:hypothetical protein